MCNNIARKGCQDFPFSCINFIIMQFNKVINDEYEEDQTEIYTRNGVES